MTRIEISLLIAAGVALAGSGYVLLSGREQAARVQDLEREVAVWRAQEREAEEKSAPARAPKEGPRPVAELMAAAKVSESDLADQVVNLAAAVEKLQKTTETLDSRITRSRLAVPTEEQRKAQIARGQARLEELRKGAQEAREAARKIAVELKVPFDEKRLLESGATPALEDEAEFVTARDAAAAQERVVALFEKKLGELQFSTLVEALPGTDGK